jgi:hypothetical protein
MRTRVSRMGVRRGRGDWALGGVGRLFLLLVAVVCALIWVSSPAGAQGIGSGIGAGDPTLGSVPAGGTIELVPPKISASGSVGPEWLFYLGLGLMVLLVLGANLVPTRRGHQD